MTLQLRSWIDCELTTDTINQIRAVLRSCVYSGYTEDARRLGAAFNSVFYTRQS